MARFKAVSMFLLFAAWVVGLDAYEECFNYTVLDDYRRAQTYITTNYICDSGISVGWYRFSGAAGNQMLEVCVPNYRCDANAPGWLNGNHPLAGDGIVSRQVCYHWNSCCDWANYIDVRNCTGFYVYRLQPPPQCNLRYCGNGVPDHDDCYPNLCANGGTCVDVINGYRCNCDAGFSGRNCTVNIDDCQPNPCKNGGFCVDGINSFSCICALGFNGENCSELVVSSETGVTVICGDGNMTVALEKARYSYLNASLLHLRGSWCRATESATHLYLSTDLNDCSTTFIETESSIIFMNEIQGDIGRISSVVTRDHDFDLQFNCSYSRKKFLSLSFTPEGIVIPPGQVGFGNLTFKMDFYRSSSYVTPYNDIDYPLSVPLNEFVYLQYSVESATNLVVMAVNCKATKDGSFYSSPSYGIVRNGCPQDTTMEYSYSSTQNFQRLKIRTFRFFNNYDTVYFHCELLACHRNTPNSRCSQGCVNSKKRKRRGVTTRDEQIQPSTTKSYVVKRGPILITQEKEETKDTGNTDKQAVVIGSATAAGGVGLVGLIVLAVLFVKYRIARLLLNRSRVGDLYTAQDEHLSRRTAYIQEDDMIEKDESL